MGNLRRVSFAAALVLVGAAAGCVPKPAVKGFVGGVTYVPTTTPGVMFVIVDPHVLSPERYRELRTREQPGGGVVGPNSQYILLCDGRAVDGMRCQVASEASLARWSFVPHNVQAPVPVSANVAESVPGEVAGGAP